MRKLFQLFSLYSVGQEVEACECLVGVLGYRLFRSYAGTGGNKELLDRLYLLLGGFSLLQPLFQLCVLSGISLAR